MSEFLKVSSIRDRLARAIAGRAFPAAAGRLSIIGLVVTGLLAVSGCKLNRAPLAAHLDDWNVTPTIICLGGSTVVTWDFSDLTGRHPILEISVSGGGSATVTNPITRVQEDENAPEARGNQTITGITDDLSVTVMGNLFDPGRYVEHMISVDVLGPGESREIVVEFPWRPNTDNPTCQPERWEDQELAATVGPGVRLAYARNDGPYSTNLQGLTGGQLFADLDVGQTIDISDAPAIGSWRVVPTPHGLRPQCRAAAPTVDAGVLQGRSPMTIAFGLACPE